MGQTRRQHDCLGWLLRLYETTVNLNYPPEINP